MDAEPLANLREWAPLTDLLNKVPVRVQKGFLYQELNITCLNVLPNFIALGTNVGIVFWYNRCTGDIQKLRCETTSRITCLKTISSVEYLVAAGSSTGQVNVFVIQKEHSADLNLVAPVTKLKPIERYTIKELHFCPIKCVEWSKNGMKLFSGDQNGVVVLTEFDFQTHISKSVEILNEAYEIVQICFNQPWLLISTIYRAIVCERENDGKWNVLQIGKRDRKVLSDFGAIFIGTARAPTILCGRPGFRFWVADTKGNVSHTYLLKDAVLKGSAEVPLLNPSRINSAPPSNFGLSYSFMDTFLVTHNETEVFILNLDKLKIETSIRRLRNVLSLAICENEIFILEGPRTIVRIGTTPEPPDKTCSKIIFNPMLSASSIPTQNSSFVPPVEFEAEEEDVINAEECFELPPIEHIDLTTPLQHSTLSEHNLLQQDQMLLEHSKKAQIFEKINKLDYDSSILFNSGPKKKKNRKQIGGKIGGGIVEIGQPAEAVETIAVDDSKHIVSTEHTTRPCLLEVSFCEGTGVVPDLRSPNTINKDLESKEKILAEVLNIEPVKLEKVSYPQRAVKLTPDIVPEFHYSLNYSTDNFTPHTTPLKRIHFLNDDTSKCDKRQSVSHKNPIDHHNFLMKSTNIFDQDLNTEQTMAILLSDASASTIDVSKKLSNDIPEITKMPKGMNIPKIWNVQVEHIHDEVVPSKSPRNDGDWELIDM